MVCLAGAPSLCYAFRTGAGLISLEEGDDRHRPGVMVSMGYGAWESRFFYVARSFGPVLERSSLLTVAGLYPLPVSRYVQALTGMAVLNESTDITYTISDANFDKSDSRYNVGLLLGLRATAELTKTVFFQLGWDAAIFPAGIAGGLFLSTGRKQILFTGMGIRW